MSFAERLVARFWEQVDKTDGTEPAHVPGIGACWPWIGKSVAVRGGYGVAHAGGSKTLVAHRFSWMATYGAIPDGAHICHRCDNPLCVRPTHLFAGSHMDNMADMKAKERYRVPGFRGERNPAAKLSHAQVDAIRRALEGAPRGTKAALARGYGVSQSTIGHIASGKKWKR